MLSNFTFIADDYPQLAKIGHLAERNIYEDPSTTLSKLRLMTEKISKFIAEYEGMNEVLEYNQMDRLKKLEYEGILPSNIKDFFHTIRKSGNRASHSGDGSTSEAIYMLRQAYKIAKWFFAVYENIQEGGEFIVPEQQEEDSERIKALEQELLEAQEKAANFAAKVQELSQMTSKQKEERLERAAKLLKMEETEAETRERIDQQLRDAGWECDTPTLNFKKQKTLPQKGKYRAIAEWKCGHKWADYALFNGLELIGIVEAKKHSKNVMSDLGQAKIYSQIVEPSGEIAFPFHANHQVYKVPFLFSTNGKPYLEQIKTASGIWFWDARKNTNIARPLPNWFSPRDLIEKLNYDEENGAVKLQATPYDYLADEDGLNLRGYQIKAIKAVEDKILSNNEDRRALLAMATGTGKTRTMIGMCYRLVASGRFRRILFLVDRKMLGKQAGDAFKEVKIEGLQTFAEIYDMKELEDAAAELDTKIHFATVQSMVKRVAYSDNPPSVGDYDCIVVDEAHRGYILDKEMEVEELILRDQKDFQSKYRLVLDYFDAYRIGLTATPAVHTAEIFGEPVFTYSYRQAVVDGYLIDFEPPYVFQTKLTENGIVWNPGDKVEVYDPEKNEIVDAGIAEDEIRVEIASFNKRVISDSFNRNILRALIEDYGIDPEDRKKTLIFAANNDHADMVVDILKQECEELLGSVDENAIVKITGEVYDRDDQLLRYKNDQYPSIVVTVDLLTTGIDVPSICNLVFLRRVNSRILYDQMVGRATRRCDDIGKEVFKIYDAVGVTELMAEENVMHPVAPRVSKSFADLNEEIALIEDEYLREVKLERIIAKLQRKVRSFTESQNEKFNTLSNGKSVQDFALELQSVPSDEIVDTLQQYENLWGFLDREKGKGNMPYKLYSTHQDEVREVSRAYSNNLKPKDYLDSFTEFIQNNKNKIAALNILCTKPGDMTRRDLRELQIILDEKGFTRSGLNTAYKEVSNEAIVADIIAHIRRSALGTSLIGHKERISNAVQQIKDNHDWNSVQLKWLDKIEQQLLKENIITIEDLNKPPFSIDGGQKRLEKIFKTPMKDIIEELNEYLYA